MPPKPAAKGTTKPAAKGAGAGAKTGAAGAKTGAAAKGASKPAASKDQAKKGKCNTPLYFRAYVCYKNRKCLRSIRR